MAPWLRTGIVDQPPPTAAQLASIQREVEVYVDILRRGGLVLLGSDAPLVPGGITVHTTLRAFVQFGMTAFEALRTATVLPARMLGVEEDLGTIEPGKLADITFVDGNPFANFNDFVKTSRVMKNGLLYTQEEIIAPYTEQKLARGPGIRRRFKVSEEYWLRINNEIKGERRASLKRLGELAGEVVSVR